MLFIAASMAAAVRLAAGKRCDMRILSDANTFYIDAILKALTLASSLLKEVNKFSSFDSSTYRDHASRSISKRYERIQQCLTRRAACTSRLTSQYHPHVPLAVPSTCAKVIHPIFCHDFRGLGSLSQEPLMLIYPIELISWVFPGKEMDDIIAEGTPFGRIMYLGDGSGDFCACTRLRRYAGEPSVHNGRVDLQERNSSY